MNENVENQPDYMHGNIAGHGIHRYPVSKGSGMVTDSGWNHRNSLSMDARIE